VSGEKYHPRPFSFRCTGDTRDEVLRRAKVAGLRSSDVIRQIVEDRIADSSAEGEAERSSTVEALVGDLLLQNSQLVNAVGQLGQQLRIAVEAILSNLEPERRQVPKEWLDRRFPSLFPMGEAE